MASALIIPGVQVKTVFEPSPVLPGQTGILGVVGVVDRGPMLPTPIGNVGELVEIFGPATRYTMPEVRAAFANGVSRAVIARLEPGRGQKASLDLLDDDDEKVVTLQARAEGGWGNRLAVKVTQVKALSGQGVKYVNVETFLDGKSIEAFPSLVMDETSPNYLFDRINNDSRVLVAFDPLFQTALPSSVARTVLAESDSRAAFATLKVGGADVIRVEAKRTGRAGNQAAVTVRDGRAALRLTGPASAPSVEIIAREPGAAGTGIRVSASPAPDAINIVVAPAAGAPRSYGPLANVGAIVSALASDPDVVAEARGTVLPSVPLAATPLGRRVTIEVTAEGRDTGVYADLADVAAITGISDPVVTFSAVPGASQLPDVNTGVALRGGRNKGAALQLVSETSPEPMLELAPAPGVRSRLAVGVTTGVSSIDNATGVVTLTVFQDDELTETFNDLTMDPDDPNYLPQMLSGSALIRAHDLFLRSRTTSFPRHMVRPVLLTGGTSPLPDDYQAALERLESAEEVDLVIASVAAQFDERTNNADATAAMRAVHRSVVAHCTKMGDVARNRIGLGSATVAEQVSVPSIRDHADDVRSDHFILCAPAGSEAAVAGLLGRQDFFQSPTFKTIAALDGEPGRYSDTQLEQLITGNVLVVNARRGLGTIVVKGLLTSGRQVNVQRTANRAVRDVKAIADKYIGLLNNDGARNALRQQVFAMFLQMERDGALVPSTDGKDPAFTVDVYSTQADFANGIVRVDIAIRPVRAIDYIYATILVKN
ncbi:MAG TPA: hypothetical protein VGD07_17160 [Methylomirabilota bacterium]